MPDRLTLSEVRCLRLAGQELGNKDIARRLGRSVSTVENHLSNAYAKLGTSDRRQAALIVARDYPELSRLPPTPMAAAVEPLSDGLATGDEPASDGAARTAGWMLPEPPKLRLHLLGLILAFAAVAGFVTAGLVQLAAGGMGILAGAAPPTASRSLDQPSSTRTP